MNRRHRALAVVVISAATAACRHPKENHSTPHETPGPPCPEGMRGFGATCLDVTQVPVGAYAKCVAEGACERANHSAIPEVDDQALFVESKRCSSRLGLPDAPINCVTAEMAEAYCRHRAPSGRLPTTDEWKETVHDLERCSEKSKGCPVSEWLGPALGGGFRFIAGRSYEEADGDDAPHVVFEDLRLGRIGFRCAAPRQGRPPE